MLSNYLSDKTISLNNIVNNKEEAIKLSCEVLESLNMIKKGYYDDILKVLNEFGPYFVIIPEIALVHANSSDSVIEDSLGLLTFSKGIKFSHKKNDPVKIIFILAAKSADQHLSFIQELAAFLSDEYFIEMLKNETKKEKIIEYIKGRENERAKN